MLLHFLALKLLMPKSVFGIMSAEEELGWAGSIDFMPVASGGLYL